MSHKRVYLGGTCNGSTWRDKLIPLLEIPYFNSLTENWNADFREEELKQRATCDFLLYCINPKMTGCLSVAQAVDDSNKRPKKTILVILNNNDGVEFTEFQAKSLRAVYALVLTNGAIAFDNLEDAALYPSTVKPRSYGT